jgi:TolB-like protein/Tfp pilus assembly protein PilF
MYEMITGKLPFKGDTAFSIALKHKTETAVDPREFNTQIPEDFNQTILKCMAKENVNRFQQVEDLLSELEKIELGIPTTERIVPERKPEEIKIEKKKWISSIAVLPFEDLSLQKDQEYFCEGLADELINALTKIRDLRVVARTSAFSFKEEKLDIREKGKRLNVDTVLEGSVRKADKRLRVTAQLINVANGHYLWSERYDHEMEDIFAIQDEISNAIVEAMKLEIGGEEREKLIKHYTEDIEAYNLYLQGRHFHFMFTEEHMKKAVEYFYLAITKDANNALAYAGLANHYNQLGFLGFIPPKQAFQKAEGMAKRALEIDPSLAEAHSSVAAVKFWLEWNWDDAEKEFKHAIKLSPGSVATYLEYSVFLAAMGRSEEAIATAKQAIELDPLSPTMVQNLGGVYFEVGRYDDSLTNLKKALELNPNYAWAQGKIAWNYTFMERHPEAIAECKKTEQLHADFNPWLYTTLAYIYSVSGEESEALKILNKLKQFSKERYIDPLNFAVLYSGLGQIDQSFAWLKRSYENRSPFMVFMNSFSHSWLKSLASDKRYKDLLKKVGFI